MKQNCWEYMKCGREEGGAKAKSLGICPVPESKVYDSINHGKNAGRFCWAVAGTFCNDELSGSFAQKLLDCLKCSFLKKVNKEENRNFKLTPD